MTKALCPCAAVIGAADAMDDLHVYPKRVAGVRTRPWCMLCGLLTTPRPQRFIPAEVATAYRVGGLGTVRALVGDDVEIYGKLVERLHYTQGQF